MNVIAINYDRTKEATEKFITKYNLTFPFLMDGEGQKNLTRNLFDAGPFPYAYVIDGEGRLLYLHGSFHKGSEKHFEEDVKYILFGKI